MAYRYLIYRTDFGNTIVRESAVNNPSGSEGSIYTDFVIPQIQPLYLWRVVVADVEPNSDENIRAWIDEISPAPSPDDYVTYSQLTGVTGGKVDIVTGATNNVAIFAADGNLQNGGYTIPQLTGLTTYTFVGSGNTVVSSVGNNITIFSPTGDTTAVWGNISGTLLNQTDLWNQLTGITASVDTKLNISNFNAYTGDTQPILDGALTGVTNLGTGTTLGGVTGRDITFKSISTVGGVTLLGDANNLIISGETNATVEWGDIIGTLSNQTDLWNELTGITADVSTKLNTVVFNDYTGVTETRISDIEDDITGLTTTKLNISTFNSYTGATETRISDIEDDITDLFNESLINITGATNGLSKSGSKDVKLGGELTQDTVISGLTNDFTINVDNITLQSVGAISLIDANGVGGINIESDGGVVKLQGNDVTSTPITKIEVGENTLLITDNRITPRGIQYNADYSATFQNRSLVDKAYVDAVATGLIPKANVRVTTTTNITLSGTQIIDGVSLISGDRVLVKDQIDAEDNGIYIVAAGAWSRSTDFDGNSDGEVSDGDLIPVLTGNTNGNTLWVLVTPNPIIVGTTELNFTLFSSPLNLQAGVGIGITGQTIAVDGNSLVGNSLSWTGNTFNVDINSGTLSTALSSKLNVSNFNSYTGATETRLTGLENDINYISGVTDTKLDSEIFTGYTANTATNEIFLIHTGGTNINTVAVTGIVWHSEIIGGSLYDWTGGTNIKILQSGNYEINYNIPFTAGANANLIVGANIVKNGTTVLNTTSAAGTANRSGSSGSIGLPSVVLTLAANDVLALGAFRTGVAGTVTSAQNGSILIKKKNTLQ